MEFLSKTWFKDKSIAGVIKHPKYGYVIPMYSVKNIIKTKRIRVNVWPDNDDFNFWQDYDVAKIFVEKTTYETIELKEVV